jgi:hypothetical protein
MHAVFPLRHNAFAHGKSPSQTGTKSGPGIVSGNRLHGAEMERVQLHRFVREFSSKAARLREG